MQEHSCRAGSTTANCTDEGSYFIADFVFVKEVTIGNTTILDVRIADTKLSANTAFTTNQKDAMKLIPGQFNIRTYGVNSRIKGLNITEFTSLKTVPINFKIYKIYSGGSTSTLGGVKK